MIKKVIREGVPSEGRRPISEILDGSGLLPDDLIIDVFTANKLLNKRVVTRNVNGFENVAGRNSMIYGDDSGLLVSHKPERGTAKPLEITANDHISLNRDRRPRKYGNDIRIGGQNNDKQTTIGGVKFGVYK